MAGGDLIAFLNSDDEWYVDQLSKQIKEFDANKDVVAVFCGVVAIGPGTDAPPRIFLSRQSPWMIFIITTR